MAGVAIRSSFEGLISKHSFPTLLHASLFSYERMSCLKRLIIVEEMFFV